MHQAIILDCSGSMAEPVGRQRRIDVLQTILDRILPAAPGACLIAFASIPVVLDRGARLPEPGGSTALHLALEVAAGLQPEQVIVLTDGEPNDPDAALEVAGRLGCKIVGYYCGDEDNHAAIAFLRALGWQSTDGMGAMAIADLRQPQRLTDELRLLLTGPAA